MTERKTMMINARAKSHRRSIFAKKHAPHDIRFDSRGRYSPENVQYTHTHTYIYIYIYIYIYNMKSTDHTEHNSYHARTHARTRARALARTPIYTHTFSFSFSIFLSVLISFLLSYSVPEHIVLADILSRRVSSPLSWRLPQKRCPPRSPTSLS